MILNKRRTLAGLAGAALLCVGLATPAMAAKLPGEGVRVQPVKSSLPEEMFQTLLVMRALDKLGYDVQPVKELEYATSHVALASGDATFLASHWNPLHEDFYQNAGGDAKLFRHGPLYVVERMRRPSSLAAQSGTDIRRGGRSDGSASITSRPGSG